MKNILEHLNNAEKHLNKARRELEQIKDLNIQSEELKTRFKNLKSQLSELEKERKEKQDPLVEILCELALIIEARKIDINEGTLLSCHVVGTNQFNCARQGRDAYPIKLEDLHSNKERSILLEKMIEKIEDYLIRYPDIVENNVNYQIKLNSCIGRLNESSQTKT
ncbi:MAG: hypothetical protein A2909_03245 [Candidatus Tagabacteria bacterium RIFCSPLOWO2_01_FULL_39_11]|uniref:Uncharacterized protein n=1 Tax=Candidatus Tagabacteria bacterium RIFCSPLOWO2_01_FULL_39_11 TaxID=1802295 RepID=A0A1G2LV54_9BACT|nr:MAG: hypothetical protein A2909_03245 [Candidatus Tagabacteria bacterium RIFCSPLOWO2_01_FULL_39_11]